MRGWWEPRAKWGAPGAGVGCVRGRGGWGNIRVLCIVLMKYISCHGRRPLGPASLHHGPWGLPSRQAGGLQVPDFVPSSLSRFYFFEHFIKIPKPNHCFHVVLPLLDRASFSALLSKSSLLLGGKEERRGERHFCVLPASLVLLQGGSWEHSTAGRGSHA